MGIKVSLVADIIICKPKIKMSNGSILRCSPTILPLS